MRISPRFLLLGFLPLAAIAAVSTASFSRHAAAEPQLPQAASPPAAAVAAAASASHAIRLAALLGPGAAHNLAVGVTPLAQPVQGTITVAPSTVESGGAATVTLTTSGFFDLSQIKVAQIGVRPADGISGLTIVGQSAQHLTLSIQIADKATAGTRTLFITDSQGDTVVALDLTLTVGQNVCSPQCAAPAVCRNNVCVTPHPPPPPPPCNPDCDSDHQCVHGRCVDFCTPHCKAPTPFCQNGVCTAHPF